MKYIILFMLLAFMAKAQEPIKALRVGDKLPETFWQQQHTIYSGGQTFKQTLAPYKGKLLLLDFWATWCGTCIKKFPQLDTLNQLDMKALLVSSLKAKDSLQNVALFFKQNAIAQQHPQASIVNDSLLTQLFPFKQLPHYVWIDHQGRLIAITNYLFANVALVQKVLESQQRALSKKEAQ